MDLDAANAVLLERGAPAYRVAQMRQAITRDLITSWDEALTLPKDLRVALSEAAPASEMTIEDVQRAKDGTVKARFATADGFPAEAVLMRSKDRHTVCLSSHRAARSRARFAPRARWALAGR